MCVFTICTRTHTHTSTQVPRTAKPFMLKRRSRLGGCPYIYMYTHIHTHIYMPTQINNVHIYIYIHQPK